MDKQDKHRILSAMFWPMVLLVVIWAIYLFAWKNNFSLIQYGLKPRTLSGLTGIFTLPFIHANWSHIIDNSVPVLFLGSLLFYFYRPLAWRVILFTVVISGVWVWVSARPAYHVGASGLIYGLAAFLIVSGIIRKNMQLLAITLLVTFLYGGMVWGLLPLDTPVSWEGHLWGAVAGVVMAYYYREKGPKRKLYQWEVEEIVEAEIERMQAQNPPRIIEVNYEIVPNPEDKGDEKN